MFEFVPKPTELNNINDDNQIKETVINDGNLFIRESNARDKEDPLYWSDCVKYAPNTQRYDGITFNMLSNDTKRILECYTSVLGCPFEYVFWSAMVAVCAAVGKRAYIKTGHFTNHPQIFCAIVGRSGLGKTPPINAMIEPLVERDEETYNKYTKKLEEYKKQTRASERTVEDTPKWAEQLIVSDVTPEALYEILTYSASGVLWHYDELAGLFANMYRYSKGNDFPDKILSIYSNQSFKYNRKYGIGVCNEPCVSIVGGIQPRRLIETFGKFDNGAGFLGRWNFVVPSSDRVPEKPCSEDVSEEVVQEWRNKLLSLSTINSTEYKLSADAESVYREYYCRNQQLMNKRDFKIDLEEEIRPKMYCEILRISLILHLLNGNAGYNEISSMELINAITIREQVLQNTITLFLSAQKNKEEAKRQKMSRGEKFRLFLESIEDGTNINKYLTDDQWGQIFGLSRKTINEIKNTKNNTQST